MIAGVVFANQVPRSNDDPIFAGIAQALVLDEIPQHVAVPKGSVIAGEGLGRSIFLPAHGKSQQSIVDVDEYGYFRIWFVVLGDLPLNLDELMILRSFEPAFTRRSVALGQAEAGRLRSCCLGEVAPVD